MCPSGHRAAQARPGWGRVRTQDGVGLTSRPPPSDVGCEVRLQDSLWGRLRPRPGGAQGPWSCAGRWVTGISLRVKIACCCGPWRWRQRLPWAKPNEAHSERCLAFPGRPEPALTAQVPPQMEWRAEWCMGQRDHRHVTSTGSAHTRAMGPWQTPWSQLGSGPGLAVESEEGQAGGR